MAEDVTIVLANAHSIVRYALRALLDWPDFRVVGEASTGQEAVQMVGLICPSVLVAEGAAPHLDVAAVAEQIREHGYNTRVVALASSAGEGDLVRALRAGVTAYILQDCQPDELITAIREAAGGRTYVGQSMERHTTRTPFASFAPGNPHLTYRQREVLQLILAGRSTKEIGIRLCISPRTVEFHRANIMRDLGVRTQVELVRHCLLPGGTTTGNVTGPILC